MTLARRVTLGFGLLRDRAHHGFVDVDVLDLDVGDLDPPRVRLRVEDTLDIQVEFVALREHFVELVLAEHRAQRRLSELARRLVEVRHLNDRFFRLDHAEVDHRVHLDGHVVARDHVLAGYVHYDRAQVDAHHLLDTGNHQDQSGAFDISKPAEGKHDSAFILAQNAQRGDEQNENDDDGDAAETHVPDHFVSPRVVIRQ